MISWNERPIEIRTLLNPAFCGEILSECISEFNRRKGALPFPLVFLILPIILHPKTRSTIPYIPRHMHIWIQTNREILIDFPQRVQNLAEITRETITFLLQLKVLQINENGELIRNPEIKLQKTVHEVSEVQDCINKCRNLGKLFAGAGNSSTIYTMWGIKP